MNTQSNKIFQTSIKTSSASLSAGETTAEVAGHAGRLLERSLLGELRAVAARALSGLDMFSGDLGDLLAADVSALQLATGGSSPPSQVSP